MAFARWFPADRDDFRGHEGMTSGVFVAPTGEIAVRVATDDTTLLQHYVEHNTAAHRDLCTPAATLFFASSAPVLVARGGRSQAMERPPARDWYDAAVDVDSPISALVAGVRHYGLLKSLVAGLTSLALASTLRQGVHAAALSVRGRGIAIVGGAGAGKTSLFLRLLHITDAVTTDDWCDLCLTEHGVEAVGLERNVSINTVDVRSLVGQGLLPPGAMTLSPIPHGHRDKIVLPLQLLIGERVTERVPIHHIYVLADVVAPHRVTTISGSDLDDMLSAVSTHMPLCAPPGHGARWPDDVRSTGHALAVRAARRAFFVNLAACLERDLALWLLPRPREPGQLAAAINLIRGQTDAG